MSETSWLKTIPAGRRKYYVFRDIDGNVRILPITAGVGGVVFTWILINGGL